MKNQQVEKKHLVYLFVFSHIIVQSAYIYYII